MSMQYCEDCDKQIDTDFDAEHFDGMFDNYQPDSLTASILNGDEQE